MQAYAAHEVAWLVGPANIGEGTGKKEEKKNQSENLYDVEIRVRSVWKLKLEIYRDPSRALRA